MAVNTTYEPYSEDPDYIEANRALVEQIDLTHGSNVVDIACGTGLLTELLLARNVPLHILGLDISRESLEIARRKFAPRNILCSNRDEFFAAMKSPETAILFEEADARTLSRQQELFDVAVMGNAIHLLADKPRFLSAVYDCLTEIGTFAFNTVFYVGTLVPGSESVYTEWMKESYLVLQDKLREQFDDSVPRRRRGTHGRAFDKGWLTPGEWEQLLHNAGFSNICVSERTVRITQRGLELVGAYSGLSEVLMSGYPVHLASDALQEGARRAFRQLGISEVPRNWLEVIALC